MKIATVITKTRVSGCADCPFVDKSWYGDGEFGGYVTYCNKSHRKIIAHYKFIDFTSRNTMELRMQEQLTKIPAWCPLPYARGRKPK